MRPQGRQHPVAGQPSHSAAQHPVAQRFDRQLIVEMDIDAPVAFTFLFDFADADLADFGCGAEVGAAAGLQVDAFNLE